MTIVVTIMMATVVAMAVRGFARLGGGRCV
jgi:hypothetical protein